jgi:hypothetical protein
MASGLGELSRASRTCVRNAVAVHVYEDLYDQGQIGALSLHGYAELAARLCQKARFTVRRWTPSVVPQSGREANEAALVKRELVDLQHSWLRAIDAAGVYVRAVAAGRPTRALLRADACLPHRAGNGISPAEGVGFVSGE